MREIVVLVVNVASHPSPHMWVITNHKGIILKPASYVEYPTPTRADVMLSAERGLFHYHFKRATRFYDICTILLIFDLGPWWV